MFTIFKMFSFKSLLYMMFIHAKCKIKKMFSWGFATFPTSGKCFIGENVTGNESYVVQLF